MTSADINSHDYWNGRFDKDWESNLGKEQSRFFANVALAHLPRWIRSAANLGNWTICDWGCAQGDGTDVLASYFARERVVGIDFAESAVDKARAAYPGLRFEAQDWLSAEGIDEKFNVVFSSNTLEHFVDPFSVLAKLFEHAEQCVVLALPYRELDRISEHFFTFTSENIPFMAHPDWLLTHSAVIDCRSMDPTYWFGDQIILVYVNRAWAGTKKLVLRDCSLTSEVRVASVDHTSENLEVLHVDNERLSTDIATIAAELRQLSQQWAQTAEQVVARDSTIQGLIEERYQLQAGRDEMEMVLTEMRNSTSWRITSPFRALAAGLRKIFKG